MKYKHLSLEEREILFALRDQGVSFREIGKRLQRSHTSLSREYKRHSKYGRPYIPCHAQRHADRQAQDQRYKAPLKNPLVFLYVREKLRERWSPETIAGRLSIDYPDQSIHPETIYRYIYNSKKTRGMKLWRYLKHHRKRRLKKDGRKVKKSRIVDAVRIDQRPEEINTRLMVGHWETDNMGGKTRDYKAFAATIERKTRFVLLNITTDRTAKTRNKQLIKRLNTFPKTLRKTLTADNGSENTRHKELARDTGMDIYFCHPYASWEKGSIENRIGRVRDYIPKGTSIDILTPKQVKAIEYHLNHRPMKCLDWKTPYEAMMVELRNLESS